MLLLSLSVLLFLLLMLLMLLLLLVVVVVLVVLVGLLFLSQTSGLNLCVVRFDGCHVPTTRVLLALLRSIDPWSGWRDRG